MGFFVAVVVVVVVYTSLLCLPFPSLIPPYRSSETLEELRLQVAVSSFFKGLKHISERAILPEKSLFEQIQGESEVKTS